VGGRFGCANVMLIFGIEDCGPFLLEQNDQWSVKWARYMTLETIAPFRDDLTLMLPAPAT
jgi:putative transposase